VRYTVARQDACAVLDRAAPQIGKGNRRAAPIDAPLPGGDIDDFASYLARARQEAPAWLGASGAESLVRNYGTRHRKVLEIAAAQPELARCVDGTDVSLAEVTYACRHELATSLSDVIFRRTHIATGEAPSPLALEQVGGVLRSELHVTGDDLARQRTAVAGHLQRYWASRASRTQAVVA
jgi:glycerol-3-phosphate dehydrogenase